MELPPFEGLCLEAPMLLKVDSCLDIGGRLSCTRAPGKVAPFSSSLSSSPNTGRPISASIYDDRRRCPLLSLFLLPWDSCDVYLLDGILIDCRVDCVFRKMRSDGYYASWQVDAAIAIGKDSTDSCDLVRYICGCIDPIPGDTWEM